MEKLRVSGIVRESIVDGPGIRFVIFSQGCTHKCVGCHNPQTFEVSGGYQVEILDIIKEIKESPLLDGVTFSGGEPFLQPLSFAKIAEECHRLCLDVICFTGYTFEELLKMKNNRNIKNLLKNIDILIDGPFILEQRSMLLKFRGSKNQRVIDVKQSLNNDRVLEMDI